MPSKHIDGKHGETARTVEEAPAVLQGALINRESKVVL